jgi:hypothetical protein
MLRMEMNSLREYCINGDALFTRRLRNFEKKAQASMEHWDEDHLSDMRWEMETHIDYNCYFGVMMAFAAFERFLTHLYGVTLHLGTAPELRDEMLKQMQSWKTLENYKQFFKNVLQLEITKPDKDWEQMRKLQAIRNAIVHQNGLVPDDNKDSLKKCGYKKPGEHVEVTLQYVLDSIELVTRAATALLPRYIEALKKKKLIPKK